MSARRDDLIVRDLGVETIVYDRRANRAHCLGRAAAAVSWDGRQGPGETAHRVSQALGEPLDDASVRLVLRRLYRAGLVERPAWGSDSRREPRPALGPEMGVLDFVTREVEVECLPSAIPSAIHVDVTELRIGQHLEAAELKLLEGVEFVGDPEVVVASVKHAKAEEVVAPVAAVAPTEAAAEPEVITKGKKEEAKES